MAMQMCQCRRTEIEETGDSMYHFFVPPEQVGDDEIRITGSDVNHIGNVLRMRPGEKICVSDGQNADYYCIIDQITPEQVTARIVNRSEESRELPSRIWLFQGLPKGDKMELIIQKAVELGVYAVIPVAMKRSVVKLDEKKAAVKKKRWEAVSESAAKQSGRQMVPLIGEVTDLKGALKLAADMERKLLPYENETGMEGARRSIESCGPGEEIAVLIGPEGGFEPEEAAQAQNAGFAPISLGKRILRTETAGLCVLSVLMFQLEGQAAAKV